MFLQLLKWYVSDSLFWFEHCSELFCLHQQMQTASFLAFLPANTFVQVHIAGKVGLSIAYSLHAHTSPQPVWEFKNRVFPADCQITSFFICISSEGPPDLDFVPPRDLLHFSTAFLLFQIIFYSLTLTKLPLFLFSVGSTFQSWGTALLPELQIQPRTVGSDPLSPAEQCEHHRSHLFLK